MKQKKKTTKKGLIGTIVFYVVVVFLAFYIVLNIVTPDRVVDYAGFQLSVIPSGSMEPEISVGDIVIFTAADRDNIAEGDIVSFNNYTNMNGDWRYVRIVHRIIDIEIVDGEEHYITQGDANSGVDVIRQNNNPAEIIPLTNDMIIAEVKQLGANDWALRIPYLGYAVLFLQWLVRFLMVNPILFLLIIVNIGIIIGLIIVLRKGKKEKVKTGKIEDKNRMKAQDVTDSDTHERDDDEEDGSA